MFVGCICCEVGRLALWRLSRHASRVRDPRTLRRFGGLKFAAGPQAKCSLPSVYPAKLRATNKMKSPRYTRLEAGLRLGKLGNCPLRDLAEHFVREAKSQSPSPVRLAPQSEQGTRLPAAPPAPHPVPA